jgi:hypothetical protein
MRRKDARTAVIVAAVLLATACDKGCTVGNIDPATAVWHAACEPR